MCGNNFGCNSYLWILILLIVLCGSGNGCGCNSCGCSNCGCMGRCGGCSEASSCGC